MSSRSNSLSVREMVEYFTLGAVFCTSKKIISSVPCSSFPTASMMS